MNREETDHAENKQTNNLKKNNILWWRKEGEIIKESIG